MGHSNPSLEDVHDYGLYLLDVLLRESGHFLEDFPNMPLPTQNWATQADNTFIAEQLNYEYDVERERAAQNMASMNLEQ
ncbi:hypothetical protein EV361DRAFT_807044, partial [Lentinula raphanica]